MGRKLNKKELFVVENYTVSFFLHERVINKYLVTTLKL